jgi:DNA-directed RNA polymerase specialized sigma24 family protein
MKNDFELMAKFKAGDSAAFHALARRHHVSVHNFFFMLSGRESAAQELTRGLFEQIVADRYRLPLERKFSTSLYRMGYSRWIAFEQTGGPRRHEQELPNAEDAEKIAQIVEQKEALRLLALLPRELKFLLVLSETLRLSFRQIAEILDISEEAVARRLSDAYALIKAPRQPQLPYDPSNAQGFPLQLRDAASGEYPTDETTD